MGIHSHSNANSCSESQLRNRQPNRIAPASSILSLGFALHDGDFFFFL